MFKYASMLLLAAVVATGCAKKVQTIKIPIGGETTASIAVDGKKLTGNVTSAKCGKVAQFSGTVNQENATCAGLDAFTTYILPILNKATAK